MFYLFNFTFRKEKLKMSCLVTTKVLKPEPSKIQENNQQAKTYMGIDKNQQDNNEDRGH